MTNSVLCAVDISHPGEDANVLQQADHHDTMMEEAKTQLNTQVGNALGEAANAKIRHIVAFGKTYEEVLNAANKAKSSLIVVGAHKPDFADYLLGPNAARIVRHSTCSVHVVR